MKSLNPVDRALAAAFVCSGAAYAQALENPDTDWRQLTPEEDAAARDLIQSKGRRASSLTRMATAGMTFGFSPRSKRSNWIACAFWNAPMMMTMGMALRTAKKCSFFEIH